MRLHWMHDERGSLPMALLAVIVIGSLVSVLVATVVSGERHTRFDQQHEQAIQVAEDGLDRMVALIEKREHQDTIPLTVEENDGGRWAAQAVWDPVASRWTITSTGTSAGNVLRTVQSTIEVNSLFDTAAFGKFFTEFAGDNYIDAYESGRFVLNTETGQMGFRADLGDSSICNESGVEIEGKPGPADSSVNMCEQLAGEAVLATNGRMFLRGQTFNQIDGRVEIHYARERVTDPLPNATGYCQGVATVCAAWTNDNLGKLRYYREEMLLPFDPVVPPEGMPILGSFNGRDHANHWYCDGEPVSGRACLAAGETYVFTDATFFTETIVEGTPDEPTTVFIVGMLRVPQHQLANFREVAGGRWEPKPPGGLLIFSSGTGPAIDFRNHSHISAGVYAPNGAATGGAQVNIYGSLVAGSINNNGGWNFHFDVALRDIPTQAPLFARNWTETVDHLSLDAE